jgi:predicted amidohydrolase
MAKAVDRAAEHKPDLVVLSENFVDRGVRGSLPETSQPIPGPATDMLARKARQYKTWIVTTLHEVEKELFYNTAVVIDREGRIAGKYRKIHLATSEGENGITPGSDYAVFSTDFGKIGVLTCWDYWFVETARILRLKGAEMLVLPIAGDGVPGHWDVISRARAIDNGVYLVSSNTVGESSSRIIDPTGKVLAETTGEFGIAYAEVDMDAVERVRWLSVGPADGDPRDLYIKERRPDTYGALARDMHSIKVSTEFENGSLESHQVLSNTHVRAKVRAESDQNRRNRQPSWFYFRLDGVAGCDLTVDLTGFQGEYNFRPTDGQWAGRMRPFYSYDNRNWQPFEEIDWDREEARLRLHLKPSADQVWIARIPPYTNRDLKALLAGIDGHPHLDRLSIGQTPNGRPMDLLTITNPAVPVSDKNVIWLMARQHAWEAGTSWVAEGAIRWLLSSDPAAVVLRDRTVFKVLPLCDPDGVARGGVRFNANGYDLNRNWDVVDPAFMPEIAAQRKAILDWVDGGKRIDLLLAIHNEESNDFIEGPLTLGGPQVRALGERFWKLLDSTTKFDSPKGVRDMPATTTAGMKGRMTVYQGLFHERKIPAFLMELKTERNTRLGREATVGDRMEFGAALVRAMAAAVSAN